jgi:GntR family transcriptional regulator
MSRNVGSGRSTKAKNGLFLDRQSRIPLYRQIEEHLRQMLPVGAPSDGRVFIEQDLANQFGVSRMTVRQAIRELVGEGLIYRVRGAGTFLTSPKMTESLESLHDNFEDWGSRGRSVALRVIEFTSVEAGSDVARRLQVPERTTVQHIVRLWIVDGSPIGLAYFYLHPSVSGRLSRADVMHDHIRVALANRLHVPIRGEQVEIEAAAASPPIADRLAIRAEDPVLIRRVTQFYGEGRPLVAANCYYRGDLYRYTLYVPAAGGASRPTGRVALSMMPRPLPGTPKVRAGGKR